MSTRRRRRRGLALPVIASLLCAAALAGGGWWWLKRPARAAASPATAALATTTAVPAAAPTAAGDPAATTSPPAATIASITTTAPATASPPAAPPAPIGPVTLTVSVGRNETLEQIFRREGMSLGALATMREDPEVRAQLDRLVRGEHLVITHLDGIPQTIVRERSLTERSIVRLVGTGYRLDNEAKPVETIVRDVHGSIDSSLFAAGDAAGIDDGVILQLAKIFGWDIDFALDLRRGDTFTVRYQRLYQYGRFVRDGEILAARFVNDGREFRAVRYQAPDGSVHYYTPEGRSMERQFLRAPLEFRRISSRFSSARYHPILNRIRAHKGVDYAAPVGTRVYAAGDGRIRRRGQAGGYGNEIEIEHGAGISTVYGHLSRFAAGQGVGTRVRQGELIGFVGMTGLATGPHLHYEYRVNGSAVDPQRVRWPDATPIDGKLRDDFFHQTSALQSTFAAEVGPPLAETGPSRR